MVKKECRKKRHVDKVIEKEREEEEDFKGIGSVKKSIVKRDTKDRRLLGGE